MNTKKRPTAPMRKTVASSARRIKRPIHRVRRLPTKRALIHALNVALQQLDRKSEPCYNTNHGKGDAHPMKHKEILMSAIHHTILKSVAAAGARIEEVTGQSYKFVLTNDDLALRATGDDARVLRQLAQDWANGEETTGYGLEEQVETPEYSDDADDEARTGSLIKDHYKEAYKAGGHADDCGDWLAETLRRLTHDANGFVRGNFTALCELNGVTDWSKYLTGPERGQNGRLKMSAGNRLRAIVRRAGFLRTLGGDLPAPKSFTERK